MILGVQVVQSLYDIEKPNTINLSLVLVRFGMPTQEMISFTSFWVLYTLRTICIFDIP